MVAHRPGATTPAGMPGCRNGVLARNLYPQHPTITLKSRRKPGNNHSLAAIPELELEPLAQRYTRLTKKRYQYECATQGMVAELEVNDLGLITCFEGFWEQLATG